MKPAKGLVIGNKYELVRPLAEGGMGSLWVAHHGDLEVDVAVKFMAEELADDDTGRRRFRREAKAAAKLRSPHVAQVLDFGVEDDTPYIVMELLEGRDLAHLLEQEGPLSPKRTEEILTQLGRALKLAHDHGIVHRDLKPSNVFVARVGDERVVKILDFGIAKQSAPEATGDTTQTGAVVGSPRYMSPEQTVGEPVDHRSDLWSLAVMTFQMLTLSRPFDGQTVGRVISRVCSRPPPTAEALDVELPPAFDAFFERALHKNRERRFQSVQELLDAFGALAEGASSIPPPRVEASAPAMGREGETVDLEPRPTPEPHAGGDRTSPGLGVDTPITSRREGARWALWGALGVALLVGYVSLRDDTTATATRPATSTRGEASPPASSVSAPPATAASADHVVAPAESTAPSAAPSAAGPSAPAPSAPAKARVQPKSVRAPPTTPPVPTPVPTTVPTTRPSAAPTVDPFSGIVVP